MLFSPSSPTKTSSSPAASSLLESIFSYDGNVMVAAIISLLLVILFVLLLHVYAKWFLAQARQRSRGSSMSHVLGPARFHHFNTITIDTSLSSTPTKGLEAHVISTIPLFVYESKLHNSQQEVLECAICLSIFEDQEMGRKLSKCGHAFHVECIDMWLHAHTNCPICRAPAMIMTSDHKDVNQTTISDVVVVEDLNSIRSGSSMSELSPGIDIVVEIPSSDSEDNVVLGGRDSLSDCSSSSSLSSINGSLKRMLSRNSLLEGKVHPSSANDESDY